MADDILLTPEQQDERAQQWFKEYGLSIFIGLALGVGGLFAYNYYKDKVQTDAEQASLLYSGVLERFQRSELTDISKQVTKLKDDYSGTPYAAKAALLKAKQLTSSDMALAVEELKWVIEQADETGIVHVAKIRLAKLYIEMGKLDEADNLLQKTTYDGYDSYYLEIAGDIAKSRKQYSRANEYYQQAVAALSAYDYAYAGVLNLKRNGLPQVEGK